MYELTTLKDNYQQNPVSGTWGGTIIQLSRKRTLDESFQSTYGYGTFKVRKH